MNTRSKCSTTASETSELNASTISTDIDRTGLEGNPVVDSLSTNNLQKTNLCNKRDERQVHHCHSHHNRHQQSSFLQNFSNKRPPSSSSSSSNLSALSLSTSSLPSTSSSSFCKSCCCGRPNQSKCDTKTAISSKLHLHSNSKDQEIIRTYIQPPPNKTAINCCCDHIKCTEPS